MGYIQVREVAKTYGTPGEAQTDVLEGVSFQVARGEFVSVFGPIGSGKTTLLKIIAGLEVPTRGNVTISGLSPTQAAKDLGIGFVFQNFGESLFPWLTVRRNISLGLDLCPIPPGHAEVKVSEVIADMNLREVQNRYPYELSVGQQQLVAISRAMALDPDILLLDEPFNSLDYYTRLEMDDRILDLWRRTEKTILFVSHDPDEAILLAQRVLILDRNEPSTVSDIIPVNLPETRDSAIMMKDAFVEIRKKLLESIGR